LQADEEKKVEAADAEEDDGRTVNLMSQEGDQFQVEVKVAKMSELVKTMIPEEVRSDPSSCALPASPLPGFISVINKC
jgi:hypothetical protein